MADFKDASELIRNLIKDTFGSQFNAYFMGSPNIQIPEGAMPCVVVQKMKSNIAVDATSTDAIAEQIMVSVLTNRNDDLNEDFETDITIRKLELLVEGRDAATGDFKHDSIVGLLRHNLDLGGAYIDNDVDTDYTITPRVDQPAVTQANVTIIVRGRVYVSER